MLPEYMALARLLQPAMVVIEDADLIARDRSARSSACDEVMLNRLLNELDGLRERADVFFILTTNRPDTLEPALASRPGRIDQTIEFPLPDEALRRRLVALYARTLPVPATLVDELARLPTAQARSSRSFPPHRTAPSRRGDSGRSVPCDGRSRAARMLFSGGVLNVKLLGAKRCPSAGWAEPARR